MENSDRAAARLEHDRALKKGGIGMLANHTALLKQFNDSPGLKKRLVDTSSAGTSKGIVNWSPFGRGPTTDDRGQLPARRMTLSDPVSALVRSVCNCRRRHAGDARSCSAMSV